MTWKLPSLRAMPETLSRSQRSDARKFTRALSSSSAVTGCARSARPRAHGSQRALPRCAQVGIEVDAEVPGSSGVQHEASSRSPSPSRSFTARTSRELSPSPSTNASEIEERRVGVRERDAGPADLEAGALERARAGSRSRSSRCGGSGRRVAARAARRAPAKARSTAASACARSKSPTATATSSPARTSARRSAHARAVEGGDALARAEDRMAVGVLGEGRRRRRRRRARCRASRRSAGSPRAPPRPRARPRRVEDRVLHGVGEHVDAGGDASAGSVAW